MHPDIEHFYYFPISISVSNGISIMSTGRKNDLNMRRSENASRYWTLLLFSHFIHNLESSTQRDVISARAQFTFRSGHLKLLAPLSLITVLSWPEHCTKKCFTTAKCCQYSSCKRAHKGETEIIVSVQQLGASSGSLISFPAIIAANYRVLQIHGPNMRVTDNTTRSVIRSRFPPWYSSINYINLTRN